MECHNLLVEQHLSSSWRLFAEHTGQLQPNHVMWYRSIAGLLLIFQPDQSHIYVGSSNMLLELLGRKTLRNISSNNICWWKTSLLTTTKVVITKLLEKVWILLKLTLTQAVRYVNKWYCLLGSLIDLRLPYLPLPPPLNKKHNVKQTCSILTSSILTFYKQVTSFLM